MKNLGIYIHIPFCIAKCKYCGFYSRGGSTAREHKEYVDSLMEDIREYGRVYGVNSQAGCEAKPRIGGEDKFEAGGQGLYTVDTIFIGGGTPTIIEPYLIDDILDGLRENFNISAGAEITIDSNPKTLTAEKLGIYREAGINRLSIGVQSFDAGILKTLGRKHTAEDAVKSFRLARQQGFDNINLDLMFAIPGHSMKLWEETLGQAISLGPEHISFYSLQIEEGTPFFEMFKAGEIDQVPDELDREMYHMAIARLKAAGYGHYEISNCAKPGYECKHNLKYWSMEDYLGIGSNASSFMGGVRFTEEPSCEYHENSKADNMAEFVFTGLRKIRGIDLGEFEQRFGCDFWQVYSKETLGEIDYNELRAFVNEGFLIEETIENRDMLRLSEEGMDISNRIMSIFV